VPCSRPDAPDIVRRVDSLSGAGIHHIEEKGNSYPSPGARIEIDEKLTIS
jgi:hypothetical protein